MTNEKKLPWGKWYWSHWRKDVRLHRCSYAARGLWADMLALMGDECDRFGYLIMEGQPCGASDLAGLFGGSEKDVAKLLAELESRNVFSRLGGDMPDDVKEIVATDLPKATIFSRRMVRDKAKEEKDRANGKGGGNPKLVKKTQHGKPQDPTGGLTQNHQEGVNPPDKAKKKEDRSQNQDHSEANASGEPAAAPTVSRETSLPLGGENGRDPPLSQIVIENGDYAKPLFQQGLRWLASAYDQQPKALRSLLGRWQQDIGNNHQRLWELLVAAQTEQVADPKGWIAARLKGGAGSAKSTPTGLHPEAAGIIADMRARGDIR